ncbi:hypothetical protein EMA8858_04185 [Emticicia aquatica]|uniref:Uncharacterized protein n=1 Tax=Emticicia aquatica TaxID=1681835 RepID=A0ABM9AW55_9BACT|nr:hypothetical protein EMA8858_04185 [Emticicia aquatica]
MRALETKQMNKFLRSIIFTIGIILLIPLIGIFLYGLAYFCGSVLGNDSSINTSEPINYMFLGGFGIFVILFILRKIYAVK